VAWLLCTDWRLQVNVLGGFVQRVKPEAAGAMNVEGRSDLQRLLMCNRWE
jgi:hypothetical protein